MVRKSDRGEIGVGGALPANNPTCSAPSCRREDRKLQPPAMLEPYASPETASEVEAHAELNNSRVICRSPAASQCKRIVLAVEYAEIRRILQIQSRHTTGLATRVAPFHVIQHVEGLGVNL